MIENISDLKLSEEKFKILFELSPVGMAMIDYETGEFLEVNQSLLKAINYTKEEFLSLSFYDITPKEYNEQEAQQFEDLKNSGKFGPNEKEYIRKDGSRYPIKISGFSFTNLDNKKVVWGIIEDISERKQYEIIYNDNKYLLEYIAIENSLQKVLDKIVYLAEKRNPEILCSILLLDEKKERLRTGSAPSLPKFYNDAVNGMRIGEKIGSCGSAAYKKQRVIVEDIDTHENWQNFLGMTQKANLHACWSEPIISSQNEVLGTFAIYSNKSKSPNTFMLNLIETYANIASKAIEKDKYSQIVRNSKKELEKEKLFLENILSAIPDMIWLKDKNGIFLKCNSQFLEFFNKKEEEIIGKTAYDLVSNDLADKFKISHDIAINSDNVVINEEWVTNIRTGEEVLFDTSRKSIKDINGEIVGVLGLSHDITKKEEKENKLKELNKLADSLTKSQQILLSLFDKGNSTLFKWKNTENWPIEYVSLSISQLLGYSKDEFISNNINYSSYIHEDDISRVSDEVNDAITKGKDYFQHEPYRIVTKDKKEKWVLDSTTVQKDDNGKITHFIGTITDISDQIHNQEMMYHQSKIAALGEMLGNISHQWRQPLSVISIIATGTKLKKDLNVLSDEEFAKNMESINEHAQYLSSTIDDFRDFFSSNIYTKDEINLKDSLNKAFSLVKDAYKSSNIKIIQNLDENISMIYNENIFIQAIINILNNAKDALNKIENTNLHKYVFITLEKEKNFYTIKIKDNANGIEEKHINKIFEPYFTTKHQSQGTGIGLYMSTQILTKHLKASISVENVEFTYLGEEYKGAQFEIRIPIN